MEENYLEHLKKLLAAVDETEKLGNHNPSNKMEGEPLRQPQPTNMKLYRVAAEIKKDLGL
jgi:hypothetical protein